MFRLGALTLALAAAAASACVIRAGGAIATPGNAGMEFDTDRPGSDFHNFDLAAPSPEICRDTCASDGRCVAYTYVRPGVQGPSARCWLKNAVPNAVSNGCCVSGVKGYAAAPPPPPPPPQAAVVVPPPPPPQATVAVSAPPPPPQTAAVVVPPVRGMPPAPPRVIYQPVPGAGPLEHDVDRPGSDIQNFDLPQAEPSLCQRACLDNPTCVAFTFVRPGVQGPRPRCWLKNAVPNPIPNGCCVSGVKGPMVLPPRPPGHHHGHDGRHGDRDKDHRGGHRRSSGLERNVDRPGSDFQNFDLPRADPDLCERACLDNPACRAFTFVRPGVQGSNARCWLKNAVPTAVPNGCCVSGVR